MVRPTTQSVRSSNNIYLPVGHPDNPFSTSNQVARLFTSTAPSAASAPRYDTQTQRDSRVSRVRTPDRTRTWGGLYIRSNTDITQPNLLLVDRLLQGLAGAAPYGYYESGSAAPLNDPAV